MTKAFVSGVARMGRGRIETDFFKGDMFSAISVNIQFWFERECGTVWNKKSLAGVSFGRQMVTRDRPTTNWMKQKKKQRNNKSFMTRFCI